MNIALFLSSDGIALAHRQAAGHWAMIGETALDVPDLTEALAALRAQAVDREGDEFEALLVLPDDQILYTSLTAPTSDPELTAFRIEEGLDGLTPYTISELEYDWRMQEEDRVKIAVVARETLDEARGFALQYGFVGAGFAAMPPMQRFPGVPLFDLSDAAKGIDFAADGIAFGPDTYGMPEEEPEPEAPEEDVAALASEDTVEASEPETDVVAEVAADPPAPEPESLVEAVPEPAPVVEPEPEPEPEPEIVEPVASDNPALAEALQMAAAVDVAQTVQPIADPSQSGPVTPISSEAAATPAPDPVEDAGPEDADLPPAPSPAAAEARERARAIRGEAAGPKPASDDSAGFAARRGRVAPPDGGRDSLVGQRSARIGLGGAVERPEGLPDPAGAAPDDGAASKMPRLSEQLERVRAASKAKPKPTAGAPSARRPRVEIDPQPPTNPTGLSAERRPTPFDGPPPGGTTAPVEKPRGGLLSGLRRSKAEATPLVPTDSAMAEPVFRHGEGPGAVPAGDGTATAEDGGFTSGLLARKATPSAGPSFRTGLILTVILLLLLAMVAIWSAVFLPDSPLARLFGGSDRDQAGLAEPLDAPIAPDAFTSAPVIGASEAPQPTLADEAAADGVDLAALEPEIGLEVAPEEPLVDPPEADIAAEDAGEQIFDIDAEFELPPLPEIDPGQNPSIEEAEALYAEDGIWARSPERPDLRPFDLLDQIYTASIDPEVSALDAVALPDPGVNPGELLRRFPPPPAFGADFDLTAQGLVAPTADGVLTPGGAFVVAGPPPVTSTPRPRDREVVEAPPEIDVNAALLSVFRPTPRPSNLSETRERQVLGGLTNDELGAVRPPERPVSPQEAAARASLFPGGEGAADGLIDGEVVESAVAAAIGGSDLATSRSLLPAQRPANIAQIVASADRAPQQPVTAVAAAAVAPGPDIPSNADVSRAATERNAIRLRNVNLIGVTGTPSDRRALVRLSSGRFVRVGVGDRLDGGRVAAIGETTLQYVRSGRTVTLEIPG